MGGLGTIYKSHSNLDVWRELDSALAQLSLTHILDVFSILSPTCEKIMAITSITIENFKCIGDAVTIPIRPITLLFGKNSSGKSTVLQALHYMYGVLKSTGADPYRTDMGGDYIDLGSFYSLVHRHESDRKIRIRIEFDGRHLDPLYSDPLIHELYNNRDPLICKLYRALKSMWIEVVTGWDSEKACIGKLSSSLGLNGIEWYCETKERPEIFPSINTVGSNGTQWIGFDDIGYWNIKHPLIDNENRKMKQNILSALNTRNLGKDIEPPLRDLRRSCFMLKDKLVEIGKEGSSNIRYLGALRKLPPRNFDPQKTPDESLWATGIEAWNILDREPIMIEIINKYMKDILKLGYTINRKEYILSEMDSKIMKNMKEIDSIDRLKEQVVNPIEQAPRQIRLKLHNEENDVDLDPLDVGLGISQVIPVLVGIEDATRFSKKRIFAVENPELHLHPAAQVALGDVFIGGIHNDIDAGATFLIETHSEHLLLRLLRRVRETNARISEKYEKLVRERQQNSMAPIDEDTMVELSIRAENYARAENYEYPYNDLEPDDLSIVYVRPTPEGTKFTPISVTDDGDFYAPWPEGFFDERVKELF